MRSAVGHHATNRRADIGQIAFIQQNTLRHLFSLAFAVMLHEAHRFGEPGLRRGVARGVHALTLPCALLMTYWQIIPDRRRVRLDIVNVVLFYLMSGAMFFQTELRRPQRAIAAKG